MLTTNLQIERYLSEREEELTSFLSNDRNSLIVAPCGSGKTYTVINILKKSNQKFIFAVPNVAVKEQLEREYNLDITNQYSLNGLLKNNSQFISCCYESIKYIKELKTLENYTLIIDEAHSIVADSHYRDNLSIIKFFKYFKNVKFLTATPFGIIKTFSEETVKFISNKKIKVDLKLISLKDPLTNKNSRITKTKKKAFVELIMSKKPFPTLFVASKGIGELKDIFGEEIIHSKNRKGERYESLINGVLPSGLTISTNLFNAGLSLKNTDEVNLIIDFKGYDISLVNFFQLPERFRKSKKINVFVINRGTEDSKATVEEVEEWIQKIINRLNSGSSTERQEIPLNDLFFPCIDYCRIEKKWFFNDELFPVVMHQLNDSRNTAEAITKEVCKVNGWKFEKIISKNLEIEIFEKTGRVKNEGKSNLKKFFINENDEVKEFAFEYIKSKVLKNPHIKEYLIQRFGKEANELDFIMSQDENTRDAFRKYIIPKITQNNYVEEIPKVLNSYFKLVCRYEDMKIGERKKKSIKKALLGIEKDDSHFGEARKIIANEIDKFEKNRKINIDSRVKSFIESFEIKVKRNKNDVFYTDKKAENLVKSRIKKKKEV